MKTHRIQAVAEGSIADELGINPGDLLADIDGEEIKDILDYRYRTSPEYVELGILPAGGEYYIAEIEKEEGEDIGLAFEGLMSAKKGCANDCIFCFVDQLPQGVRPSLCFKDDDWRLSFLSGNYITLTNVGDAGMRRICEQRISPLYISVHTLDMDLRKKILRNDKADRLLDKLRVLCEAGIEFHCQIVLMRGINDGEKLRQTIEGLQDMRPWARDCAIVPVGLTAHRDGLYALTPFDSESAAEVIDLVDGLNKQYDSSGEHNFAFCADEFYIMSGKSLPDYEYYGDFGQLEDGVGMLRHFLHGFEAGLRQAGTRDESAKKRPYYKATLATGTAAYAFMQDIAARAGHALGIDIDVVEVENNFFGGGVSVSGLLTGCDYYNTLSKHKHMSGGLGDVLLICGSSLRSDEYTFLDDMRLDELQDMLDTRIMCMPNDGEEFLAMLQRADITGKTG